MPDIIREEWQGDVRVRWHYDGASDDVHVDYWQDPQAAVDLVSTVNAQGAPTQDGLGKPLVEVPVVVAMQFCERRGIPWERFLYSNEYDTEFRRFAQEYTRLAYHSAKTVHAVS